LGRESIDGACLEDIETVDLLSSKESSPISGAHGGRVLGEVPSMRGFSYQDQVAVDTRDMQDILEGGRTQLECSLGRQGELMTVPNSDAQRPSRAELRK
jgi:hypothetical protein